jgi:3-methyladenine DNA glycosylase AlkD
MATPSATRKPASKSKSASKSISKSASKPTSKTASRKKVSATPAPRPAAGTRPTAPRARLTLAQAMAALEAAGTEQTRKTWARHGVASPMFGVSFAALKTLYKRIKADHELALALWRTGNFDARNLAMKVVDPARLTQAELDRWSQDPSARLCGSYVAQVTAESPRALGCVAPWLASRNEAQRTTGWKLVGRLAMLDQTLDDAWFRPHLETIEREIHAAPNAIRDAMNSSLIEIGCRNPALRKAATGVAKRIGQVEIDYGDTACKTPDAAASIDKAWDYALAKQATSPAAQERARESYRTRC